MRAVVGRANLRVTRERTGRIAVAEGRTESATSQRGTPSPPMRDPGGWGVAPAPDGRGTPEPPAPPAPHRRSWFWIAFVILLALNILAVFLFQPESEPR